MKIISLKRFGKIPIVFLMIPYVACTQETLPLKDHRLYIVPANILIGDVELTYSFKTGSNLFCEPGIGYHYFPFSIKQNGFATLGELAEPELGVGYYGPYVRFGLMSYLNRDKTLFIKPDLFYKIQNHKPSCYAVRDLPSEKYSGYRQGIGGRILIGFNLDHAKTYPRKFYAEGYSGLGIKFYWGTLTEYTGPDYDNSSCNHPTTQESKSYIQFTSVVPAIYLGFRIGWQLVKAE